MAKAEPMRPGTIIKLIAAIVVVAVIFSSGWWGPKIGLFESLPDSHALREWFGGLGAWGPAAVVATMTLAILVSPLPSAPVALAAGAIYGHFWGAVYVLTGSELGAIAAFSLARFLGHDVVHGWFGKHLNAGLAGSQNFLMGTVFVSRLLPFVSFDIISYAAGLTSLSFWRFAIATLAGILPASFLLAHFGMELVTEETDRILVAVVLLGALTAVPVLIGLGAKWRRGQPD